MAFAVAARPSAAKSGTAPEEAPMQFQLTGQQIEITESLRSHATAKVDRLTRLDEKLRSLAIVLTVDKHVQFAEGTLGVNGCTLHAEASEPDMYTSIDIVFDKLVSQLRKHREKVSDKHQQEAREARMSS
jgi:putative sigma-54 modulation protein